jgi:hypothetical protein
MSCTIVRNNISAPQLRASTSGAVREGIGERSGDWQVDIYQAPDYPEIAITIAGPQGLSWDWTFYEQEQSPEFIRERVAQAIIDNLSLQGDSH